MSIKKRIITCSVALIIAMVSAMGVNYKSDMGNGLRFSKSALEVLGNAEGCRRDPYLCPVGKTTQGIGHTGAGAGEQAVASDQQIARWWAEDLLATQNFIEKQYEAPLGRRWPASVFDGVGLMIFNVGAQKFKSYPTINAFLRRGEWVKACNQIQRFVYGKVNGVSVVLAGLVELRRKEMALCLRDVAL